MSLILTFNSFSSYSFFSNLSDPGKNVSLIITNSTSCSKNAGIYQPTMNGNLKYYYLNHPYDICIGSSSVVSGCEWEPRENENVSIVENICKVNNSCKLNYGKSNHEGE